MIRSKKHYTITRSQLRKWEETLEHERSRPLQIGEHPAMYKIKLAGIESQIAALNAELAEYDELISGSRSTLNLIAFRDIPKILISARLMAGLTQRELASALGLPEQQIQRYESDGYATASLERVCEIAEAVGIQFQDSATVTIDRERRPNSQPPTKREPALVQHDSPLPTSSVSGDTPGGSTARAGKGSRPNR